MSCTFTAQLAFSLCGLLGFVQVARNMVTACNNSRLSLLLLLVLRFDKSSWVPQPRIASLRPIRPQLLDGLQRFSAQLIIILLISDFRNTPLSLQTLS